jgi:hypothetical protein
MIRSGSQSGHGYQSSFAPEVASPIRGSGGAEPRPGRDSGPPGGLPDCSCGIVEWRRQRAGGRGSTTGRGQYWSSTGQGQGGW